MITQLDAATAHIAQQRGCDDEPDVSPLDRDTIPATGCFSFGSANGQKLSLDRVIESVAVDVVEKTQRIWLDVFVHNEDFTEQYLTVLHRGSFSAENVTQDAWGNTTRCPIAERVMRLHEGSEKIQIHDDHTVTVGEQRYALWNGHSGEVKAMVGQQENKDVPFTKWEIGPFPAQARCVARLRFLMTKESYQRQIGDGQEFYAYGDSILLNRIAEDLQIYQGNDRAKYVSALKNVVRIQPTVLEYILVSWPDTKTIWKTTPLSPNFSPRMVPTEYGQTIHWFVAKHAQVSTFELVGQSENMFALKVELAGVADE